MSTDSNAPLASARDQLAEKVMSLLELFSYQEGTGIDTLLPDFDYYALDYLDFAELNLRRHDGTGSRRERENELISCVSNLKRALDCQIECFLSIWGLRDSVKKRNLGLDAKLAFLTHIGLIPSRTIGRFTTLRNKIEHEFQRPEISDLEALFDLVTAVVAILQLTSGFNSAVTFALYDELEEHQGSFELDYDVKEKSFSASWYLKTANPDQGELKAHFNDLADFTYFFRVLILLNQFDGFASFDHIKARLRVPQNG